MSLDKVNKIGFNLPEEGAPPAKKQKTDSVAGTVAQKILENQETKPPESTRFHFDHPPTEADLMEKIVKTMKEEGDYDELDLLYEYGKSLGYSMDLTETMYQWSRNLTAADVEWCLKKGVIFDKRFFDDWLDTWVEETPLWGPISEALVPYLEREWDRNLFLECALILPEETSVHYFQKCSPLSDEELHNLLILVADFLKKEDSSYDVLKEISAGTSIPIPKLFATKCKHEDLVEGRYLIHAFIEWCDWDILISYLEQYPELVDLKTDHGESLFECAVRCGNFEAVKFIGQKVAEPTKLSFTFPLLHLLIMELLDPLGDEVYSEDLEILKYLISALHFDPNEKDSHGNTPLHHLFALKHDPHANDVYSTLIKLGANLWVKDARGRTALTCALLHPEGRIFNDSSFPQSKIIDEYRKAAIPNEQLHAYYGRMIHQLVMNTNKDEDDSLELAFLLGEPAIARSFRLTHSLESYRKQFHSLRTKYPAVTFNTMHEATVNFNIPINVQKTPVSQEESNFDIDRFLAFFDTCAPAHFQNQRFLMERLLYLTKNRLAEPLIDIEHGSVSLEEAKNYYGEFEERLKHIGFHYQNEPKRLTTFLSRLIGSFIYCPEAPMGVVRDECNEIDDQPGINSGTSLIEQQFCSSLPSLFKACVDELARKIDPVQSRHAAHYILKVLGKDLKLSHVEISYTDVHSLHYANNYPKNTLLFLLHCYFCTPITLVDQTIAFFDPLNPSLSKRLGAYMSKLGKQYEPEKYDKMRTALQHETSPDCLKPHRIPFHEDKGIMGSIDEAQARDYLENRAFDEDLRLTSEGAMDFLEHLGMLIVPTEAIHTLHPHT